jgi:two-component system sensor histidine kinase QseC
MRVRAPSMQGRVLALAISVVVLVWAAAAALVWFDARDELDALLDKHLAQAAAILVVQQAREIEGEERDLDAPILHRYAPDVAFQVFHDGRITIRSKNAPEEPMLPPGESFDAGTRTVTVGGVPWRVFATLGNETGVEVYVGERIASRDRIVLAVLRAMLWPMLVATPLLALALWWSVRRGVAPLRRLGADIAAREPQALQPIAMHDAPREMRPMIGELNRLLARIGSLLESERQFTDSAAHELRTPIAAIRMQAQVAMGERDDALRMAALRHTVEGCDRATRLVTQMLTLARIEGAAPEHLPDVDLAPIARRAIADLAPGAIARGQDLSLEAEGTVPVRGDETLLAVLVRNLVDNALRYSPDGARIAVTLQAAPRFELRVEDSGPGMRESDRARLGERFFRVPGSNASGSGLGWSIARRICDVHGLALEVESQCVLGGLGVRVRKASP